MPFVNKQFSILATEDEIARAHDIMNLMERLHDANPTVRRWDLMARLHDANPITRRYAARDLAEYPEAAPALIAHLKMEAEISVREVILTSLIRLKTSTAVENLVDCLRSEDVALRNEIIEFMKQFPEDVARIIPGLLSDANADVRICAVNVLGSLGHCDVEKWLGEVITNDPHVNVCATAVDILAELGVESLRKPLTQLKQRFPQEPYIFFVVDLALDRIRGV